MVWYGMVWYGMVWYGMVWYGMVWYGMVWYGMVWYGTAQISRNSISNYGLKFVFACKIYLNTLGMKNTGQIATWLLNFATKVKDKKILGDMYSNDFSLKLFIFLQN